MLSYAAQAQVTQPRRFEIPIRHSEKHFDIIPADDQGLYLHRTLMIDRQFHIQLIKLDTGLNFQWQGAIPIEKNYLVVGKKAHGNHLYILLRYFTFAKNDFILYVIQKETGSYSTYVIRGFIPFSPSEFTVTPQAVIVGGYYNRVPIVLHYSTVTFKSRVVPGLFNEDGELTQIKTNPDGSFDVLISALNMKRQRTIFIKNYDPDGDLLRTYSLESDPNKHLIFGRSLTSNNSTQIIAGVFGNRSTEYSRGIFVAAVDQTGLQQIRYYNYSDLENFFKYMKAKREQRVKSRIQRRKVKGKKIRMNYRFLVHQLVPYQDQYVLLGEAFYPKYIHLERGFYSGFLTPTLRPGSYVQNGRIFDGYHYTHAVVMGFKADGTLVWDNSFEINDVKTYTLEQFVKLDVEDERIALLYLFDNRLRTKIIKNNDVLEGKAVDPINTGSKADIVQKDDTSVNKLEYWYSDFMYAYGIQEIQNVQNQQKRRVFYINKLRHVN